MSRPSDEPALLAIDAGLRTGLAGFDRNGRLLWYRSQNFGSRQRLKRGAESLLRASPGVTHLVVEGGGTLGQVWERCGARLHRTVIAVSAEHWRPTLLLPRDQRSGVAAKRRADTLARRVIEWAGARAPTSLRHDAAEAILIGLWAVRDLGWLNDAPPLD